MKKFETYKLLGITFIVSFCSIVYELIFSQLLTILFGGTVLRYSVTIGLFLFSLGIGAFLFQYIRKGYYKQSFLWVEIILPIIGVLGVIGLIKLNSWHFEGWYQPYFQIILLMVSHIPIILVGILSGLEIPLLAHFLKNRKNAFSEVLGVDYFGSLVGTLFYALLFFPTFGLISSTIFVGALNIIVALWFFFSFMKKTKKYQIFILFLVLFLFSLAITFQNQIQTHFSQTYLKVKIQEQYWSQDAPIAKVDILDYFRTPYQEVTQYRIRYPYPDEVTPPDDCLNLDEHVQMCESWVESYHHGLVDVPLAFFTKKEKLNILILGGGDFIGVNFLKKYYNDQIKSIDLVDIDSKFMNYARTNSFIKKYNEGAFAYKKLNIFEQDAFFFLRNSSQKYDLILFDLPGVEHDKLSSLYSLEFYNFIHNRLADKGLFVMWTYQKDKHPNHFEVLVSSLKSAGFQKYFTYRAYMKSQDVRTDFDPGETFYVFSKDNFTPLLNLDNPNKYLKKTKHFYENISWENLPESLARPNSVFAPNYKIIIKYPKKDMPYYIPLKS